MDAKLFLEVDPQVKFFTSCLRKPVENLIFNYLFPHQII